jgi:hypothetical protein
MPGCEFSKVNFLASPRDLPSGTSALLTLEMNWRTEASRGDSTKTFGMSTNFMSKPKRVLEPVERISEFLFGLIMVLTLTCTFSVDGANRGSVRTLLMEALGCNVAWGMIDAFFYLLNSLGQRGHCVALLKQLRRTSEPGEARRMVADALLH